MARRQLAHQLRVADAERARGRVDALDPECAEVALALLARAVHVHPRVLDRLVRDRVAVLPLAAEALGPLEDAVTAAASFESSFSAGHDSSLCVRQQYVDLMMMRVRHVAG